MSNYPKLIYFLRTDVIMTLHGIFNITAKNAWKWLWIGFPLPSFFFLNSELSFSYTHCHPGWENPVYVVIQSIAGVGSGKRDGFISLVKALMQNEPNKLNQNLNLNSACEIQIQPAHTLIFIFWIIMKKEWGNTK